MAVKARIVFIIMVDYFQGEIVYKIVGDRSAPYYFGLSENQGDPAGRIILKNDLTTDKQTENYIVSLYNILILKELSLKSYISHNPNN